MAGFWSHRFNIVLRPLRDRTGAQSTIVLEARTAAQAGREATLRHPHMKVIQVTRAVDPVSVLTSRTTSRATAPSDTAAASVVSAAGSPGGPAPAVEPLPHARQA